MSVPVISIPTDKLVRLSLRSSDSIHYQLSPEELVQDTLRRGEGYVNDTGALVIHTGEFTGRTPKDKFIVRDAVTDGTIDWNQFNLPIGEESYQVIYDRLIDYFNTKDEYWIRDAYACADEKYRLNIRVVSEKPWHNLFCYNMFLRPAEEELDNFKPDWHILSAPGLKLDPVVCGTRQANAIILNFTEKTILIAGSGYTGETKKAIFSVLNYLLPKAGVLSMHCAANVGEKGDTAIFFGLSGTGKTTLSADPARQLIGDDEHGWTKDSVFNFEGGCYAKTIDLNREKEPAIFDAIRDCALVENMNFINGTNRLDFNDRSVTENTRVSYPLSYIPNAWQPSIAGVPENIFFLTCDASGVLPPLSKLTAGQAMYQFISGYTAKLAGTETGITAPASTFSACFGAPFLPLHPGRYAELLGKKIRQHKVSTWLVNTGWTGGSLGEGRRIPLAHTRAMISAVLEKKLQDIEFTRDPVFGIAIPLSCPGVPSQLLVPSQAWQDKTAYERARRKLAELFVVNFQKYAEVVSPEILEAAPIL